MNRYFENGVARQERAKTFEYAERQLAYSCNHCRYAGICDEKKCPIMNAYKARLDYLASGVQKIPVCYTSEKPKQKKKQVLSWQYRAKRAVVHYLDRMAKNAIEINHRKMAIDLENTSVQIYNLDDLYLAMDSLKESYPEIYYEAERRYQKYVPIEEMK